MKTIYLAGLLARSTFLRLPMSDNFFFHSGKCKKVNNELTAAGTAPDFHRIPFSFRIIGNQSDAKVRIVFEYD